jgi:hypothetical protein
VNVMLVPGGRAEDFDTSMLRVGRSSHSGHAMSTMSYRITTQAELFSRGRGQKSFQHVSRSWLEAATGPQGHTASNRP